MWYECKKINLFVFPCNCKGTERRNTYFRANDKGFRKTSRTKVNICDWYGGMTVIQTIFALFNLCGLQFQFNTL